MPSAICWIRLPFQLEWMPILKNVFSMAGCRDSRLESSEGSQRFSERSLEVSVTFKIANGRRLTLRPWYSSLQFSYNFSNFIHLVSQQWGREREREREREPWFLISSLASEAPDDDLTIGLISLFTLKNWVRNRTQCWQCDCQVYAKRLIIFSSSFFSSQRLNAREC